MKKLIIHQKTKPKSAAVNPAHGGSFQKAFPLTVIMDAQLKLAASQ